MKTAAAIQARRNPGAPSLRQVIAELWRVLSIDLIASYRPEKHYMRGPGPKWHEHQARAALRGTTEVGGVLSAV